MRQAFERTRPGRIKHPPASRPAPAWVAIDVAGAPTPRGGRHEPSPTSHDPQSRRLSRWQFREIRFVGKGLSDGTSS